MTEVQAPHPAGYPGGEGFYDAEYRNRLSVGNRVMRSLWSVVYRALFVLSPVPCFGWRRMILRLFGARLHPTAKVYPTTRIWAPWNLSMGQWSALGPEVYCYNVAEVCLERDATVSFRAFLCTASHDIRRADRPLISGPIRLRSGAYVFADAFIGMNVTLHEGAVAAARAVVVKDVAPYDIVGGNPAKVIGSRR